MSQLLDYRAAVVAAIKSGVTGLVTVDAFPGIFNAVALQRYTVNSPAVLVAMLQSRAVRRDNVGHLIGPVVMAAYCVTKDPYQKEAWGPAIELAERVSDFVELNHFGLDYAAAARVRDLDILYSADVDKTGLAIAAVTFTQEVAWGRSRHAEDEASDPMSEITEWPDDPELIVNDGLEP